MTLWRRFLNLFRRAPPECDRCGEPFAPWKRSVECYLPDGERAKVRRYTVRHRCYECSEAHPPHLPLGWLPVATTELEILRPTPMRPSTCWTLTPDTLSDEQSQRLKAEWEALFSGNRAGEIIVLGARPTMPPNRDVR